MKYRRARRSRGSTLGVAAFLKTLTREDVAPVTVRGYRSDVSMLRIEPQTAYDAWWVSGSRGPHIAGGTTSRLEGATQASYNSRALRRKSNDLFIN